MFNVVVDHIVATFDPNGIFVIPERVRRCEGVRRALETSASKRARPSADIFVFPEILFIGVDDLLNERVTYDVAAPKREESNFRDVAQAFKRVVYNKVI